MPRSCRVRAGQLHADPAELARSKWGAETSGLKALPDTMTPPGGALGRKHLRLPADACVGMIPRSAEPESHLAADVEHRDIVRSDISHNPPHALVPPNADQQPEQTSSQPVA